MAWKIFRVQRVQKQGLPSEKRRRSWKKRAMTALRVMGIGTAIWSGVHLKEAHDERVIRPVRVERSAYAGMPENISLSGKPFKVPKAPPSISMPEEGDWCSLYARLAAEKLFGIKYTKGFAWQLAGLNKSVWQKGNPACPKDFHQVIRSGHLLGIFIPSSSHNESNRPYTHVALYVGIEDGRNIVFHRIRRRTLKDDLDAYLESRHAEVREVIEPR
ncbi:MAG: hypothetical protein HY393_03400 [Candidatus Diapherotrites archaeon]|nr:hypothetical protein [Candidatus Diapherotrites archaeon]